MMFMVDRIFEKGWCMHQETQVLIAGIDTLILNAKQVTQQGTPREQQTLPFEVGEHLRKTQGDAKVKETPFPTQWKHQGQTLMIAPHGVSGWKWLLKNGLIDVMVGALLNNAPLTRVRFSSEYLWKHGIDAALAETSAFLTHLFGEELYLQVAELHLCADVMGLDIPKDYERVFVSRAKLERPILESNIEKPIYRHHRLETLQFSGHASPMSATIYNKPKEIQIKSKKKVWFHDLWKAQGWTEDAPIWRVECRMKRECLHEMDIEEVHDAIEKIPALWAYCTGHPERTDGWLRMVLPNEYDTNRWRWETTDAWKIVQQAFLHGWRGAENMADIQRERKRQVSLEAAEAAIAGYITTYAAWLQEEIGPDDDVSVVMSRLYNKIQKRWEQKGVDFQGLRLEKMFDYHLA